MGSNTAIHNDKSHALRLTSHASRLTNSDGSTDKALIGTRAIIGTRAMAAL